MSQSKESPRLPHRGGFFIALPFRSFTRLFPPSALVCCWPRATRIVSARAFPTGYPAFLFFSFVVCFLFRFRFLPCPHWLAFPPAASRGPTPPQGNPGWPPCFARLLVQDTDQNEQPKLQNNTMKTNKNSKNIRAAHPSQTDEQSGTGTKTPIPSQLTKLDFTRRQANRQLPTEQLLQLLREKAPQLWEIAQVVGKWVWIQFPERQSSTVTTALSEFGFNWNKIRQTWQHPCGDNRSAAASYDPRRRYGSRPAAEILATKGGN